MPSSVSAREVVEAFKRDRAALAEFAGMIVGEPDLRLAIINAVLRDVATRDYVDKRLNELEERLRREILELSSRLDSYLRWTVGLIIAMWTTTLIPLLLKILGVI